MSVAPAAAAASAANPYVAAGTAVVGTIADYLKSQQQMGLEREKIAAAQRNDAMQAYLTNRGMDLQERAAFAGQTDAYGNQLIYDPTTNTWVSKLSPQGQAIQNRSDAIGRMQDVRNVSQESERDLAQGRRIQAGQGAQALLTQLNRGYGAPTREGVAGTNAVAAATGASEAGDIARGGFTAAGLRSNTAPNLAQLDRSQLTGLRTSLAGAATQANPLYEQMLNDWRGSRTNAAGGMTGIATAPDVNFTPSTMATSLDNASLNRAVRAQPWSPYTGYSANAASKQLLDAMGGLQAPDYGRYATALSKGIGDLFASPRDPPIPWNEDSRNPGAYNSWRF